MRIIGFNFNKISIERLLDKAENIKINSNINIIEIKEAKSDFFNKEEDFLTVTFEYSLNYDPDFAKLAFSGNVLFSGQSEKIKEILSQWKNKQMPEEFKIKLFNIILRKTNLKALQLEEEINIPFHMQLPSLKIEDKKEE